MTVRQKLGEILAKVELRGEEFVIEKGGVPKAMIIPYHKVQMMRKKAANAIETLLDKAAEKNPNPDLSDDEVEQFVNQAIHEARKNR